MCHKNEIFFSFLLIELLRAFLSKNSEQVQIELLKKSEANLAFRMVFVLAVDVCHYWWS